MARNYKDEYARRKARDQAAGYTSPRTRRTAKASPTEFTRSEERARANLKARNAGFRNATDLTKFRKLGTSANPTDFQRDVMLKHFGITRSRFEQIRKENKKYYDEYGQREHTEIYTYNTDLDRNGDWSERRVGYVISFHAAVVNPRTNYDSLPTVYKKGSRKLGLKSYRERKEDEHGKRITNSSQYFYLVKYARIMSVDYFEARYGRNAIRKAMTERTPKP